MENKINQFLELLEEAKNSKNIKVLNEIEEKFQKFSISFQNYIQENESKLKETEFLEKIESLRKFIDDLENQNNLKNKIFNEFKEFIDNRKFK
jgi:transcriptional regulator of heat shock response